MLFLMNGYVNELQELYIKKEEQTHNNWMGRKSCCSWI
jgi:hypothetical protein